MDESGTAKHGFAPSSASDYLDISYWDQRFTEEEHYEWFKDYSHFRHLMLQYIEPNHSVLEVGCGNSQLSEGLYRDGITEITCIDLSSVAVEKMKQRLCCKGYKEIKVLEADMLDLPFEDEIFDVIVEKGTMDVLLVDAGDPWNPEPATVSKVMKMLEEVHRVLKPHGVFISITFGQPHFRRRFFNAPTFTWSVEWSTFGDGFHYFVYALKKGKRSSSSADMGCHEDVGVPSLRLLHDELDDENYLLRSELGEM